MTKTSSTDTQDLEDSCTGSKKELDGGGFTCKNKDGKWVTCIPNSDSTSNCYVSSTQPPTNVLDSLIQVLRATEAAIEEVISPDPVY